MSLFSMFSSESKDEKKAESPSLAILAKPVRSAAAGASQLKGKKGGSGAGSGMSLPPSLNVVPRLRHVYRFRANSTATAVTATIASVVGALGGIATVTNSVHRAWTSSFRIKSVTVWLPGLASSDSCYLDWFTTGYGGRSPDASVIRSIPDGITVTGKVRMVPPPFSLCSDWTNTTITSSQALFSVTCPTGSIVDFDVESTLSVTLGPISNTVASAVLGSVYYLALDGPAANVLRAIGLPTTA